MAKKFIQKYLPHPTKITGNRWIKALGPRLQEPDLWHISRKSSAQAAALGMFCAFIPVPFQMLLAATGSIFFRCNILISVSLVWISNPVTIPVIYYFCYRVGALIIGTEVGEFYFEPSLEQLFSGLLVSWKPFLLGSLLVATTASLLAFVLVKLLWYYHIRMHLQKRRQRPKTNPSPTKSKPR